MCHGEKGGFSRSAQLSIASQCMGQGLCPLHPSDGIFFACLRYGSRHDKRKQQRRHFFVSVYSAFRRVYNGVE